MQIAKALRSAVWIASQPQYLSEFARKAMYRLRLKAELKEAAQAMSLLDSLAVSEADAFNQLFPGATSAPTFEERYQSEISDSHRRIQSSRDKLGGAAALNLLHQCTIQLKPDGVIETGVAYGWSSFAILAALDLNDNGRLVSIDFPQLGTSGRSVGAAIPDSLKTRWSLLVGADRAMLPEAIASIKTLNLCHYDSDKSIAGRVFAYPLLWEALKQDGLLISDDIGDNLEFIRFSQRVNRTPIIVRSPEATGSSKFIGVLRR